MRLLIVYERAANHEMDAEVVLPKPLNVMSGTCSNIQRLRPAQILSALVLVALIVLFYRWTVRPGPFPDAVVEESAGYFNLLTRGFLKGQLNLDVEADPFLATLENPWDPAQRAGRGMHDASYFDGKYYIYFGITPVMMLFLPFHVVTGLYVSESMASLVFATVGFMATVLLLVAIRRRYFSNASWLLFLGCIAAVGLGTMMPSLLRRASVWEVSITSGYACAMLMLFFLFHALHSVRPGMWLAAASVMFGLAVGARPVYVFGGVALVIPLWHGMRLFGGLAKAWRDAGWRWCGAAAVGPAAAIGIGLAFYNYARFGDPLEFGQAYQMAGDDVTKLNLFDWKYVFFGFRIYVLEPAGWSPYFPYVKVITPPAAPAGHVGIENAYGILPNMPFLIVGLGVLMLLRQRRDAAVSLLRVFSASAFALAFLTMIILLFFGWITNRYMVDFAPGYMVLACIGSLVIATSHWFRGWRGRWVGTLLAGLLIYSIGFNLLVSLQHNELLRVEHPAVYRSLAYRANRLSNGLDRWFSPDYGPVEMKIVFPRGAAGRVEPLLVTGTSFQSDYVYVHYLSDDSVRFGFEHTSYGGPTGEPVRIEPGRVHTVRIEMGSLYPPLEHPYFDEMSPVQRRLVQRTLRVTVEGVTALQSSKDFYDATSWTPSIGTSGDRPGFPHDFSGEILSWRRVPEARPEASAHAYGPVRMEIILPPFTNSHNEPLVSTGISGAGDLVYIRYHDATHVSFGFDHWGAGGPAGAVVEIDPAKRQVVEIDFGALYPPPGSSAWNGDINREKIVVRLNGEPVLDHKASFHVCDPDTVSVGANSIRASTAEAQFTGTVMAVDRVQP